MSGGRVIGLAIGADRVLARSLGGGDALSWRRELPAIGESIDVWRDALRDALRSLHTAAPSAGSLRVALLPPLAEVRIEELPTIGGAQLRSVVARDASKYFAVGAESQVVQVRPALDRSQAAFSSHLLSAAPERVVTAVLRATAESGWSVESLSAAQIAWAEAAGVGASANGTRKMALVSMDDRIELLELAGPRITQIRRLRGGGSSAATDGVRSLASSSEDAAALAARYVPSDDADSLWPDAVRADRERAQWKTATRFAFAAVVLLVIATVVEWIGAGSAVSQVAAERAAIAPRVAVALATRDSIQTLDAQRVALETFGAGAARWSSTLVELSRALPQSASLISFRASGDSVFFVGDADHAADVFTALGASKAFKGVRADAPIQQQLDNGVVVAERFTIAAKRGER
jgi:hypothetical protein